MLSHSSAHQSVQPSVHPTVSQATFWQKCLRSPVRCLMVAVILGGVCLGVGVWQLARWFAQSIVTPYEKEDPRLDASSPRQDLDQEKAVVDESDGLEHSPNQKLSQEHSAESQKKVVVEVTGAVVHPGVYIFEEGKRIVDAVLQAGGYSKYADTRVVAREINQAEPLKEGQKIYIPFLDERVSSLQPSTDSSPSFSSSPSSSSTSAASASDSSSPSSQATVPVNTASQKELEELPGIGSARAETIIKYRPYASVSDFIEKTQFSSSVVEKIKDLIHF